MSVLWQDLEIGVRTALGSTRTGMGWLVLGHALGLTVDPIVTLRAE